MQRNWGKNLPIVFVLHHFVSQNTSPFNPLQLCLQQVLYFRWPQVKTSNFHQLPWADIQWPFHISQGSVSPNTFGTNCCTGSGSESTLGSLNINRFNIRNRCSQNRKMDRQATEWLWLQKLLTHITLCLSHNQESCHHQYRKLGAGK